MASTLRLFISAGERSGDMHGGNLAAAIRRIEPSVEFVGLGRERLIAAGLEPVEDMSHHSVLWTDAASRIPRLFSLLKHCTRIFREQRPNAVVLIDYIGFNLFLAKAAFEAGVPVFYYVAPQLWAHGAYRVEKLRKWVRRMLVIYPFEVDFYESRAVPVSYVGHPVFDELARNPPREDVVAGLRARFGDHLIALMPGSRVTEIERHRDLVMRAATLVRERAADAQFAMSQGGESEAHEDVFAGGDPPVLSVDATVHELALAARACIVKSGTTTLEVGAAFCPMAVFYKVSALASFVAHGLRTSPFICLVNQLAGREIVPEKLMVRSDSRWLADRTVEVLQEGRAQEVSAALRDVMEPFAAPGASERAARILLDSL